MCRRTPVKTIKQQGLALVVFVIILALAVIASTLGNVSIEQLRSEEALSTQSALNRAKQALLAYAVTYEDSHPGEYGFLPCPDRVDTPIPDEGGSDGGSCLAAGKNVLGLFPWTSLETGILKSGTGQCLWYGVSGDYKSSPKTAMLNEDSNGAMRLYDADGTTIRQGTLAQDRVVAVIIDPSKVLAGQSRNFDNTSLCGKDYSPAAFLEGDGTIDNDVLSGGKWDIDDFIARAVGTDEQSPPFNDQLVFITREELWDAVRSRKDFITNDDTMERLTEALAWCIAAYGNNSGNRRLPRPAAVDFGGGDYRDDDNYDDSAAVSYLGRYPRIVDDSDAALGATHAPNDAEKILFDKGYCEALAVAGGPDINLKKPPPPDPPDPPDPVPEGYTTWKNWKDHFFYAVSADYAPTNSAAIPVSACPGGNCIKVGVIEYAAVVMFAGKRTDTKVRNEPKAGDADTKNTLANYIEVNHPVGDGTGDYTPTGNDIAYCITDADPLAVVSCP